MMVVPLIPRAACTAASGFDATANLPAHPRATKFFFGDLLHGTVDQSQAADIEDGGIGGSLFDQRRKIARAIHQGGQITGACKQAYIAGLRYSPRDHQALVRGPNGFDAGDVGFKTFEQPGRFRAAPDQALSSEIDLQGRAGRGVKRRAHRNQGGPRILY